MNLIEILDKVNYYDVAKDEVIWKENGVLLNKKLLFNGDIVLVNTNERFVVIQTQSSGTIIIDKATNNQYKVDKNGPIISNNMLLLGKWNEDFSVRILYAWDFIKDAKVWKKESYFGKPFLCEGNLFGSLKSKLFRIDPNTGESIWHLDLFKKNNSYTMNSESTPIDIQEYIGLHNGCLYFKAGNKLIIGVSVESGKEKFNYEYTDEDVVLDNLCLDVDKGVIFSIGSSKYFELNLSSNLAKVHSLKEDAQKYKIETTRLGSWEGNLIYFWEGGGNPKFGVFDRETKKIKFVQILEVNGYPAIKEIKHGQEKVYVLDGGNRLHVFEKEITPTK
ncbi:hypothetical protein [Maribacter sp. 2308TA10-17]|uniref:hypothetical protein n=1 Tax=Maribacter sp. 2308TA10-17 TaxID=3386276 RepID=UPI0039BC76D4